MKRISKKAFDVYCGHLRDPQIYLFAYEIDWFLDEYENVAATILIDHIDKDFNAILFIRSVYYRFEFYKIEISFDSKEEAEKWIHDSIKMLYEVSRFKPIFDRDLDLFKIIVKESKMHPYFKALNELNEHSAAKKLINEISTNFNDIDGNFIEQFQSNGFNSRLWEFYLFCYFQEEKLIIDRTRYVPDFIVSNENHKVAVEAVIVESKKSYQDIEKAKISEILASLKENQNDFALNYGSSLFSKLMHVNKDNGFHYWEHEHTKGIPFVFAIADFHEALAMTFSSTSLINYLYGFKHEYNYDQNGNLVITPIKIPYHTKKSGVNIDSGFFFQKKTENISAILHTASGTLSKFDRIGKQCGFDQHNISMFRVVTKYNNEKNAVKPIEESYHVDENCDEKWSEGISIFHNPNALIPLPIEMFPLATHHVFKDGQIISQNCENHVYSSFTIIVKID